MEGTMQSLSDDLRKRIIGARERGETSATVAKRYEVNIRTVQKLWKRYRESGRITALQRGGYRRSRLADMEQTLLDWVKKEPDVTLVELCERLAEHGITITVTALWHQLNKWKLTFKKNPARQRARTRGRESGAPRLAGKSARA
jgi:transposase